MKLLFITAGIAAALILPMTAKNLRTPSSLGVKNGKLAPMPKSPNAVSTQSDDPEKKVSTLPLKENLQISKDKIRASLKAYGGIEIKTEQEHYIHAVSTTAKMKYHDDLEFYFDVSGGIIHFRSASRVGYSDMGLNRHRYDELSKLYNN